jgi:hypothetical protein
VADWLCKTQDLYQFYDNHASFLAAELVGVFLAVLTLVHGFCFFPIFLVK